MAELEIIHVYCLTVPEGSSSSQAHRTDPEVIPEQAAPGGLRGEVTFFPFLLEK